MAAVTSASNVTGIITPYHEIARIMHRHGGLCFVDFACSAPYINIDMHPADDPDAKLDAIYFSPHKFLGGPGTSGVLVFCNSLYCNRVPDHPGGGTVAWTSPWDRHEYLADIEAREDGGTPPFLQAIRIAMAITLKEQMGVPNMLQREEELLDLLYPGLLSVPGLHLLAAQHRHRLGILSFYIEGLHYNLGVKLLNDRFGVQVRGGCSCAGTYGHYLLEVSQEHSRSIINRISDGDLSHKPGWIRCSIHPTMTNQEARYLIDAITEVALYFKEWATDYHYNPRTNEFTHLYAEPRHAATVQQWFRW
jgi:selenocysteine lyase/cysteine desulfurase